MNPVKKFLMILLCIVLAVTVGACSASEEKSDLDMSELMESMLAAAPSLPDMTKVTDQDENAADVFPYVSDVDYDKVDKFFLAYSSTGLADEIVVVRMKDAADVSSMEDSLNTHVSGRVALYQSYQPDQVPRAESALIFSTGSFAVLIMCDGQDSVKSVFQDVAGD